MLTTINYTKIYFKKTIYKLLNTKSGYTLKFTNHKILTHETHAFTTIFPQIPWVSPHLPTGADGSIEAQHVAVLDLRFGAACHDAKLGGAAVG